MRISINGPFNPINGPFDHSFFLLHRLRCRQGRDRYLRQPERQDHTIKNHKKPLAEFADSLDHVSLVVCEATGGYEAGLVMLAALAMTFRRIEWGGFLFI